MLPEGKLYVPGAAETREAMARLVAGARAAQIVHVASADDRELTDPELSDDPDSRRRFRPHCLAAPGARSRSPRRSRSTHCLWARRRIRGVAARAGRRRREILLLKKSYSVFANPSAEPLVEILDPDEVVVFGVATDVCDHAAIMGMLDRGRRVAFVEDAARGLSEERVASCTAAWRERGVRFTTVETCRPVVSPRARAGLKHRRSNLRRCGRVGTWCRSPQLERHSRLHHHLAADHSLRDHRVADVEDDAVHAARQADGSRQRDVRSGRLG